MKSYLNKFIGLIYTFFLSRNKNRREINNDKYLLIICGHMGNAILIIDGLMELINYCRDTGKELSIVCDPYMWKTLNNLQELKDVNYLENVLADNARFFIGNLTRMHKLVKGLEYEKIITSLPINNVDHFLAITIPCKENWCIKDDIERIRSMRTIGFGFIEKCYSNMVVSNVDMHETQRYKKLFMSVGVNDYQTSIHDLRGTLRTQNSKYIPSNKYITIALDSMNPNRKWRLEKYSLLIEKLLQKYSYDIVLTGTNVNEIEFEKCIKVKFSNNERVIDLVGKTKFYEWLYILSKAEFHIGVDSGSIHFATSSGAQAYCITGVWDGHRVFPYHCDTLPEGLHEPICIYRTDLDYEKLPCYACKVRGTEFGTLNKACKKACKKGYPCECLENITVDDVIECLDANYR
ncbi:MAG: hypothetical protein IJT37_02255 [Lachnospiraceae bacterium]|nr:hypothetical protein [Lachnospiraceae bacterium]